MASDFPHLDNVDVWSYRNEFDYSRFGENAQLKLLNVTWCGDYENVVKFADNAARDAWFDAQAGEVVDMPTMFNVKPDGSIKVPVPATTAQRYNYLVVDLPIMTSPERPIAYAQGERVQRYFYFIKDCVQLAPNTTRLELSPDVWTTYINDLSFDYILLERGHAPVAASNVADYLANPRENSAYLLGADVNTGGEPFINRGKTRVKNYSADEQRAVLVTYADLHGQLGTADAPKLPALTESDTSGVLAPRAYAMTLETLVPFLKALEANAPWMKSAVQGVFFAPLDLLKTQSSFSLWGATLHVCDSVQRIDKLVKPTVDDFGYDARAARFAKLYTWPYAAIRVTDESGASSIVRIEDLGSSGLEVASALNLVMPYITIEARLLGIGGADESLQFQTLDGRTYAFGGAWGDYLRTWQVPVMQVTQSAASVADWSGVYTRAHERLAADNAQSSAFASNATTNANVHRSGAAQVAMTQESNDARFDVWERNAQLSDATTEKLNGSIKDNVSYDNAISVGTTEVGNDVAALTGIANAGSSLVSGAIGAFTGDLGAVGSAASSALNGAISTVISQSSNEALAELAQLANTLKGSTQMGVNTFLNTEQQSAARSNTVRNNDAAASNAATAVNAANANADASKATGDANAARAHATAYDAITAAQNQAGVAAPATYGSTSGDGRQATAPRALFAQVVTQRDCDIMNAASTFARYGYAIMREWGLRDMQVMKHFTFWKCAEVWCAGNGNVTEAAQNDVKSILTNGVTVWSRPEEIGRVSVYDNF